MYRTLTHTLSGAIVAPMLTPLAAHAGEAVSLNSAVFVEDVGTDAAGQQRRVLKAADRLGQGDRLVFVMKYRNDGSAPVRNFALTNPVPRGVRIDPAHGDMQVSVDGGRSWGRLTDMIVRTPLGGTRRATPDDVTHVRWTVDTPVAPGASGQIAWRGTVR